MGKKIIAGVISLFFIGASVSYAQNTQIPWPFRNGERVTLEADETVDRDFFATGEMIEIKGTVNGDLYTAGGNVVVDGTVNGDILAAGGMIEINGKVAGNARVAGGNIRINGSLGKNLTAGAGNIEVDELANIGGSMVFGAGNVEIDGPVGGNVVAGAGNLVLRNTVGGNVYTGVGKFHMGEGAHTQNVVYWSENEALVDKGATVSGTLERRIPPTPKGPSEKEVRTAWAGFRFFSLLSMILIGLLFLRFFPGVLETGAHILETKPWQSLGLGLLKLIVEPIVAIIFMVTVIGFPLGIFLFFAYIVELYFASYFVAYWIGKFLSMRFNQKLNVYWTFVVGVVVFVIITSVPIISGFVRFFSLLFGLGVILLLKYSWYQKAFGKKN